MSNILNKLSIAIVMLLSISFTKSIEQLESDLAKAVVEGNVDTVRILVDKVDNVNFRSHYGPLLHDFISYNNGENQKEILEILLEKGLKVNALDESSGNNALMWLRHDTNEDAVELLLSNGLNVNHKSKLNNTALLMGVYLDRIDLVKLFLQYGADIYSIDNKNHKYRNALDYAGYERHFEIEQLLKDCLDVENDLTKIQEKDEAIVEIMEKRFVSKEFLKLCLNKNIDLIKRLLNSKYGNRVMEELNKLKLELMPEESLTISKILGGIKQTKATESFFDILVITQVD